MGVIEISRLDERPDFLSPIPGLFGKEPKDTPVEINSRRWVLYPLFYPDWSKPQPQDFRYGTKLWRRVYVKTLDDREFFLDDPYAACAGLIYAFPGLSILECYVRFAVASSTDETNGSVDKRELLRFVLGKTGFARRARFMWTIAFLIKENIVRYAESAEAEKAWEKILSWAESQGGKEALEELKKQMED